METTDNLLEKYFPQYCVKSVSTDVGRQFQDIISLGDRKIYLSVSDGILYANSIISHSGGNYVVSSIKKKLIPNYSPRKALDNARGSILKGIENHIQDLQKNPFGQDSDSETNQEILEGTHNNNLGNFLSNLVMNGEIKVAG
jgi:hypothetical protein